MGKNQSASGLTNFIQYDSNGNLSFVSGSTTLMQVSSSGAITTTGVISGSSVQSASLAQNSNLLQGTGSVGFATTGSFTAASGSVSSRLTQIESVYATTGSNSFRANQSITGSLTVTGQIIAQTINVQQVTSSIVYSSGSNVFGCDINSRQTFTGSFYQTGSVAVFNSCVGIGLNNPTNRLEVQSGDIKLNAGASRCTSVFFGITGTNYGRIQYSDMDGSMLITTMGAGAGYDLNLGTKCITRLTISGDGNVGILTCTPQQILSVNNPFSSLNALYPIVISQTGNAEIGGMYSTADSITNPIGAGLAFKTYQVNVGLTEKLRITHAGYVGIGCTSPSGKLQVVNSSTQYAVYTLGGNLELYTPEGNCGYVRLGSAYNLNGVYGSCGLNYITSGTSNHVFYTTDSACERMRITSTGITTFQCQVCVPSMTALTARTSGTDVNILTLADNVSGVQTSGFGVRILASSNGGAARSAIGFEADGGTNNDTAISFYTQASAACLAHRMIIDKSGQVAIGSKSTVSGIKLLVCGGGDYNALFTSDTNRSGWTIAQPGTSSPVASGLVLAGSCSFRFGTNSYYHLVLNQDGATQVFNTAGNATNTFMPSGLLCTLCGVRFGTGATTLNNYETGTWTPRFGDGSWLTNAGADNSGWYVRIGSMVTVGGTLNWSGGSGTQAGDLRIRCFPFAASSGTNERNVGQFGAPGSSSIGFRCGTNSQMVLVTDPGQSSAYVIEAYQSGTFLTYTHSPCVANTGIIYGFQITYHI